jgi:hypothetical protein
MDVIVAQVTNKVPSLYQVPEVSSATFIITHYNRNAEIPQTIGTFFGGMFQDAMLD